jgi:hypothetical protein
MPCATVHHLVIEASACGYSAGSKVMLMELMQ